MIFVEPHGLRFEALSSDKVTGFHDRIREYTRLGLDKSRWREVAVDAWIVSATSHIDMKKQWNVPWDEAAFAVRHILFPDSGGKYLNRLLDPT